MSKNELSWGDLRNSHLDELDHPTSPIFGLIFGNKLSSPRKKIDLFVNEIDWIDGFFGWIDASLSQQQTEFLFYAEKKVEGDDYFEDINEIEDDHEDQFEQIEDQR